MMTPVSRLISLVLVLRYDGIVPYGEFSGRRAQRLFFDALNTVDPALVQSAHDDNSPLAYSIGDMIYTGDHHFWIRVASAEPHLAAAMAKLRDLSLPRRFDTWELLDIRWDGHEWAREETLAEVIHHIWNTPPPNSLLLDIHTPTSVRSLGLYRALPDPVLLFRSLYERWRMFGLHVDRFTPDAALWDTYTQYHLTLQNAQRLTIHSIDHKKGEAITAFSGLLHIQRHTHNAALWQTARRNYERYDSALLEQAERIKARRDDLARWVHLLAHLAFYSGVGVKTGWGMGMARLVQPGDA